VFKRSIFAILVSFVAITAFACTAFAADMGATPDHLIATNSIVHADAHAPLAVAGNFYATAEAVDCVQIAPSNYGWTLVTVNVENDNRKRGAGQDGTALGVRQALAYNLIE